MGRGIWRGCLLLSQLGGMREHRKLPSRVLGGAPAENGFWCILSSKIHVLRGKFIIFDIFAICGGYV